jgi:hypothetical protein
VGWRRRRNARFPIRLNPGSEDLALKEPKSRKTGAFTVASAPPTLGAPSATGGMWMPARADARA